MKQAFQTYKQKYSLAQRKQKFKRFKQQHGGEARIPVIIQKSSKSTLKIDHKKFALNRNQRFYSFARTMKQLIQMKDSDRICFYLNYNDWGEQLIPENMKLQTIYEKYKDQDGFLYITFQQFPEHNSILSFGILALIGFYLVN